MELNSIKETTPFFLQNQLFFRQNLSPTQWDRSISAWGVSRKGDHHYTIFFNELLIEINDLFREIIIILILADVFVSKNVLFMSYKNVWLFCKKMCFVFVLLKCWMLVRVVLMAVGCCYIVVAGDGQVLISYFDKLTIHPWTPFIYIPSTHLWLHNSTVHGRGSWLGLGDRGRRQPSLKTALLNTRA